MAKRMVTQRTEQGITSEHFWMRLKNKTKRKKNTKSKAKTKTKSLQLKDYIYSDPYNQSYFFLRTYPILSNIRKYKI